MYIAPDFEMILIEASDIITSSLATSEGDNVIDANSLPSWWED